MGDVQWIKMKVGMFDGRSFKRIKNMDFTEYGGYLSRDILTAIWFELMDLAGKCNQNGSLMDEYGTVMDTEDIALQLNRNKKQLAYCMDFFEREHMLDTDENGCCTLVNWLKYQNEEGLTKIREQNRLRQAKCRARRKAEAEAKEAAQKASAEESTCADASEEETVSQ